MRENELERKIVAIYEATTTARWGRKLAFQQN